MLICWDLAFPEAFRELIAQGAKIIVIPSFCMSSVVALNCLLIMTGTLADCSPYGLSLNPLAENLFLSTMMTARAYENTCAIVFVNAGGPKGATKPASYARLSQVALPFVGALGEETKNSANFTSYSRHHSLGHPPPWPRESFPPLGFWRLAGPPPQTPQRRSLSTNLQ